MKEFMKKMYRRYFSGKKVIDNNIKALAQEEYCERSGAPHFAPVNGICWRCKKQIFDKIGIVKASSELITGCPHCNRSYCD